MGWDDTQRRAGDSGFIVNLPAKPGNCPLSFDAPGYGGGVYLGSRTKVALLKTGAQIVIGQPATLRVEVRRQQEAEHVSVALNSATVGEWTGDRNAISNTLNEGLSHDRRLSLWIHPDGNEFVFHRIRVRMLDGGSVEMLRPVPSTPPVPVAKQDLPTTI